MSACPSHTYIKNETVCALCHPACDGAQGCVGPGTTECVACGSHAVSFGQQCLLQCPPGFFADAQRVCQPCDVQCDTCTGPSNNDCLTCKNAAFIDACVASCPLDVSFASAEFQAGSGQPQEPVGPDAELFCIPCHPQCAPNGCSGTDDNHCTACKNVKYRGRCRATCPALTYLQTAECFDCHPQCQGSCNGPLASNCAQCKNYRDLGADCVASCPVHRYIVERDCLPCNEQCSTTRPGCTGPQPSQCTACANFFDTVTGDCVQTCPHGTYRNGTSCLPCHSECDGCVGPLVTNCQACRNYLDGETCVPDCPLLKYGNAERVCTRCHPECLEDCDGPLASQCIIISSPTGCQHFKQGTTCVRDCDYSAHYKQGLFCQPCSAQCDAQGCSGPANTQCVACSSVQYQGSCLATCPNAFYADGNKVCQACNGQCTATGANATSFNSPFCFGPGANQCTACLNFKRGDTCVASCNAQTEYIDAASACQLCHPECQGGCTGRSAASCVACKNFDLFGTCVSACPVDTTWANLQTMQCSNCHATCNTAAGVGGCPTGGTAADCRQCLAVRYNAACTATCPVDHYPDRTDLTQALGGICRACHPLCVPAQGCDGPSESHCNSCLHFNYSGTCVTQCPSSTFASGKSCFNCDVNCAGGCTASGPGACLPTVDRQVAQTAADWGCRSRAEVNWETLTATCVNQCPVNKFTSPNNICTSCDATCDPTVGCTGPSDQDCKACPQLFFLDRGAAKCTACHAQCAGGCVGPTASDCVSCKNVRKEGACTADCSATVVLGVATYYYKDQATCRKCDSLCESECTGAGPTNCVTCRHFQDPTGRCLANCDLGYATGVVCNPCNALCANTAGCRGPEPSSCTKCRTATLRNGTCAAACPANEVLDQATLLCSCPATSAYLDTNGVCQRCSTECLQGCSGSGPADCLNTPQSCRVAFNAQGGVCVSACASGFVIDASTKTCVCSPNHYAQSGNCLPCSDQCTQGCTGPLPSNCRNKPDGCLNKITSDGSCVAACPLHEITIGTSKECQCNATSFRDTDRVCKACHPQCAGGCTGTGAQQCSACKNFRSGIFCVDKWLERKERKKKKKKMMMMMMMIMMMMMKKKKKKKKTD